jgi:hypothetical protein
MYAALKKSNLCVHDGLAAHAVCHRRNKTLIVPILAAVRRPSEAVVKNPRPYEKLLECVPDGLHGRIGYPSAFVQPAEIS